MKVKSMRIPEDIDQAINYVSQLEKIEKTQSLRKLARLGFEYYVAKNYRDGRISLRNAADFRNILSRLIWDRSYTHTPNQYP